MLIGLQLRISILLLEGAWAIQSEVASSNLWGGIEESARALTISNLCMLTVQLLFPPFSHPFTAATCVCIRNHVEPRGAELLAMIQFRTKIAKIGGLRGIEGPIGHPDVGNSGSRANIEGGICLQILPACA